MKNSLYIFNARIVNENRIFEGSILIESGLIKKVFESKEKQNFENVKEIDAKWSYVLPGIIDDQVHFREPGLAHKGDIHTESGAAAAGGITSLMEMPNVIPQTTTQTLLQDKFDIAAQNCFTNYSFYIGATNDNLKELLKTNPREVCGIKLFMGSSTGNMLVDDDKILADIFKESKLLIATHCEDETTIQNNTQKYKTKYGENLPIEYHPEIRSTEACYKSSSKAVELATKYNTRLHVLHISTAKELSLFNDSHAYDSKRITSEACVHHLWFDNNDYQKFGTRIKWNPAIKTQKDKEALIEAVNSNKIDVVATDHAPHTLEEKNNTYFKAPSGGPLVQHSLVAMLELHRKGVFSIEKIVEKMCHTPAKTFNIEKRGFIREGYNADIAIVDTNSPWTVSKENILYKCKWSPFEGTTFNSKVTHTIINGNLVFENGKLTSAPKGERLLFNR